MGKIATRLALTTALLGATFAQSMATADELNGGNTATSTGNAAGNSVTAQPNMIDDTTDILAPEPGSIPADISQSAVGRATKREDQAEDDNISAMLLKGKYFGGRFGISDSSASGAISAPNSRYVAYGVQGGYLQSGYNWNFGPVIAGVGAYFDWNPYALHSNGVAYSSLAYGLDTRLGLPAGYWLPYIKLGYGRNLGTHDLRAVVQNSPNAAIGVEYNFASRWTIVAEYKANDFSSRDKSITISNRTFTVGFNYYFDAQQRVEIKNVIEKQDLPIPEPTLAPDAVPEAPPEP